MTFKRIVVGTDGSDTAAVAVAQTVGLAERLGAEAVVVTAFAKAARGDREPADAAAGLLRDVKRQHPTADLRTVARQGDPADVILGVTAEENADLVVVGNRGLTGKRMLGGIPDKVSHHAPCHVLIADTNWAAILPTGEDPHTRPPVASILVGTDGSPTAEAAVDTAMDLARALGAHIHLVHVGEEAHGLALLQRTLDRIGDGPSVHTHVAGGDPPTRIVDLASEVGADLIIVGNKGMRGLRRVLLGGVPNFVSHHADRSVLIVKTT